MAKILKKTRKAADNVMKWTSAEYSYLKDLKQDLEELKTHLNDMKLEKDLLRKARAALRMVGRAQRRDTRYVTRLEKDVKSLAGKLPDNLRDEELNIEKEIEVAARSILEKGSRYVGSLKRQLAVLIREIEKKGNNININIIINNLIKEINTMLMWIYGLEAAVKKEKIFTGRLAA